MIHFILWLINWAFNAVMFAIFVHGARLLFGWPVHEITVPQALYLALLRMQIIDPMRLDITHEDTRYLR